MFMVKQTYSDLMCKNNLIIEKFKEMVDVLHLKPDGKKENILKILLKTKEMDKKRRRKKSPRLTIFN